MREAERALLDEVARTLAWLLLSQDGTQREFDRLAVLLAAFRDDKEPMHDAR